MSEENETLDFVTTDELVAELSRRSQAMILGMIPVINSGEFILRSTGNAVACIGLTLLHRRSLLRYLDAANSTQGKQG
jgi:hypothetical protein